MNQEIKYDVAISLAGIHLPEAELLRTELIKEHKLDAEKIYLYSHQGTENIGLPIKASLRQIYHTDSLVIVVLLSKQYLENELTKPEWEAIKTRVSSEDNFLIPIRMDEHVMIKDLDEMQGRFDTPWTKGVSYLGKVIMERIKLLYNLQAETDRSNKPEGSVRQNINANHIENNLNLEGDNHNISFNKNA